MKKIIISVIALTGAIAMAVTISANKDSDLLTKNIEALADGESGGCGFAAYEYDDDWYQDDKNFRRCGDCEWVRGTRPQYTDC